MKSRVDYVLREYSMRYRAGTIPGEVFRRMLEEAGRTIERESPTRERSRPVARAKEVILRKRLKNLSQERLYITYDDSFKETLSTIADPPTEHEKKPVYVGHHRRASDHTEGRMEGSYVEMYNKREARQKEAVEAKNGVKAGKPSLASMRYDSEREIRVRSLSTADDHPPTGEGSDGNQGL